MAQELTDTDEGCKTFKAFQLSAGQSYWSEPYETTIRYELDADRNPTVERWTFCSTEGDSVHGLAVLRIAIVEVIPTLLCGALVAHYRQWFDGDGEPISARRRFIHKRESVMRFLRQHKSKLME